MYINTIAFIIITSVIILFLITLPILGFNYGKNEGNRNILNADVNNLKGHWNIMVIEGEDDVNNWGGVHFNNNFNNHITTNNINHISGLHLGRSQYTIIKNDSRQDLLIGQANINGQILSSPNDKINQVD